ncbi:ABC transporter ATP-binding protein [Paeniglutamicibacter sulfureus]|uniref:Sulfonate transport system ATP-binding protein n=1 Tax=Paeniglutamicibacter sulfureus TaxID=43666 RepID=A0ABU2BHU5_9MICC|nr:ABC transporter ATP-binding protein [Paeniglutamicibacter sulfureus]MDR7358195.1 sulfonate transport system ATP-binding protein [Paeniglutamicibacter sulfureus]
MTSTLDHPTLSLPARGSNPALRVTFKGVGRSFDGRKVLGDVDLEIAGGEVVAILGPSGCGKSTLLRSVSGLDRPSTGQVLIDGTAVNGLDARCAVAFQEPRLLPWQSVEKNVALGLPQGTDRSIGASRVAELLELVELDAHSTLRPREISGGMAQRTSLARALARRPGVLLLDEPFGALDALTRLKMQDLLLDIHGAYPTTVLLVTHDVDEALQLADRIVVLGRPNGATSATVTQVLTVPGARPRHRSDEALGRMRSSLLASLGVDAHRH